MPRQSRLPKVLGFSILLSAFVFVSGIVLLTSHQDNLVSLDNRINPLTQSPTFDWTDMTGSYNGESVAVPTQIAKNPEAPVVLGHTTADRATKQIVIDLTTQTLRTYEGGEETHRFLISSGKWGRTPTGTFRIWSKFRYTKMEGGVKGSRTYYYLPNVPYTMFFYNEDIPQARGFGIHGTYWHNNFGNPMSHGCINMNTVDAGVVYEWATPTVPEGKRSVMASEDNPGTEVVIIGVAPGT